MKRGEYRSKQKRNTHAKQARTSLVMIINHASVPLHCSHAMLSKIITIVPVPSRFLVACIPRTDSYSTVQCAKRQGKQIEQFKEMLVMYRDERIENMQKAPKIQDDQ